MLGILVANFEFHLSCYLQNNCLRANKDKEREFRNVRICGICNFTYVFKGKRKTPDNDVTKFTKHMDSQINDYVR